MRVYLPATLAMLQQLVTDRTLHARWGASAECLYLVRPDGYVGYRAQPADRALLAGYLDRIFT